MISSRFDQSEKPLNLSMREIVQVINVYMELMKERETREPDKFLKCHFFNTFFYNKVLIIAS